MTIQLFRSGLTPYFRIGAAVLLSHGIVLLVPVNLAAQPAAAPKLPVILDTNLGTGIDDAFALALVLASPEIDLRGITTTGSDAETRAWMICRFLTAVGQRDVRVASGRDPQPNRPIAGQIQYRRHPGVLYNRTSKPLFESAVEFLEQQIDASPGKLTLIATGPLTNVARLLAEHPESKSRLQQIVLTGGSRPSVDPEMASHDPESAFETDVPAARTVLAAGVPLVVVPRNAIANLRFEEPLRRRLFAACTPLTFQVQSLYDLWNGGTSALGDAVTAAMAIDAGLDKLLEQRLEVDDHGRLATIAGPANARVVDSIDSDRYLAWYLARVTSGDPALPQVPANASALIPLGKMPNRVHCSDSSSIIRHS